MSAPDQTVPGGSRLPAALAAAAIVSVGGALIVSSGHLSRWSGLAQACVLAAALAVLQAALLLASYRIVGVTMSDRAFPALGAFVAIEVIQVASNYVPSASWLPDHEMNWEGKAVTALVSLCFIVIACNRRTEHAGVTLRLATPRAGWRLLGPLSIVSLAFVAFGYWFLTTQRETTNYLFFEATMPGLSEELTRGISLMLFAFAATGVMSIRSVVDPKVVSVIVAVNSVGFMLAHVVNTGSGWSLHVTPSDWPTFFAGVILGLVLLRTRSIWPAVLMHNLTNLELSSPTVAVLTLALVVWAIWHRVRNGRFNWAVT